MITTSPPPSGAEKARLVRRMQAVARLRHPNLARMLPLPGGAGLQPILGEAHKLSDFTLPAGTFKRFDLEQIVRLLLDVLAGLSALHEVETEGEAFVHGEVCPGNVYVDEHGTARLVPLLNAHSAPALASATGYAAPERLLGAVPDARIDTFSVGVMLWEALAGTRLFPDPSATAVLARQVPPIRLGPRTAWAQPLCTIAERAIAFEPKARYQTAHELANAIAAAAAPQLSRVDADAWQEEAPTPVFQPRLHLASLRASAPPPPAAPSPPSVPRVDAAPPSDTVSPTVDHQPEAAVVEPRRAVDRSGRAPALALAAVALALGVGIGAWQKEPRAWFARVRHELASARHVGPSAAAAHLDSAGAVIATKPAATASAPPAVVPSAPPRASAEPEPEGSSAAPRRAPPRSVAPPAAPPKSATKTADYGI